MGTRRGPGEPRPGTWLRHLPAVSVVAFAGMALGMFLTYESALATQGCGTNGMECPSVVASPLWLFLAGTWAISAMAVVALMSIQAHLAHDGRTIGTPSAVLLAIGSAVSVLGVAWLFSAPRAGYAGTTAGLGYGLHIAYVTSALLFFAVTFVDFDPDRLPSPGWPAVLATVNAGLALTVGVLLWP